MSEAPWIKFYPSDWLAGTRGLSAAETGIYITLIMMMYERGEPVPHEPTRLARLCGTTPAALNRTLSALIEGGKIEEADGGLWNHRVGVETENRREKSTQARESAELRWRKGKQKQAPPDADAMPMQSERNAKPEARSQNAAAQQSASEFFYDRLIKAASARGPCHPSLAMGIGPMTDLIARGYSEAEIIETVTERAKPDIGSWKYFVPIIEQRARDRAAIAPKPEPATIDWRSRLDVFRSSQTWSAAWGPKPGESGCQVPIELIQGQAA